MLRFAPSLLFVSIAVALPGLAVVAGIASCLFLVVAAEQAERHDTIPLSEVFGTVVIGHFAGAC